MAKAFLQRGNGNQNANRKRALAWVLDNIEGAELAADWTVSLPPYGQCHFSAYTDDQGAMISSGGRDDHAFGSIDWHHRDKIMMFRDMGDGRCILYVCPIKPLFDLRTIGHHGVRWEDVWKVADFKEVFRP